MAEQILPRAPQRIRWALFVILAFGLFLAVKLFYWQIMQTDVLSEMAINQRNVTDPIYALRGDITTSDGVLLAKDVFRYTVSVSPRDVLDQKKFAAELAPLLGQTPEAILAKLTADPKAQWTILARDLPQAAGAQVVDYKTHNSVIALKADAQPVRVYPNGAFAAQIVGYVNAVRQPAWGVEQFKDPDLRGVDGKSHGVSNALRSDRVPFDLPINEPATNGAAVVLTINSGYQRIVETELANAIRDTRSTSGSIIVMDPKTGAVLAMAVSPTADLNAYYDPANTPNYLNTAVSSQYEPGSVFKIVTYAAALDAGTITPATTFEDGGSIYIGGRIIKNHDNLAPGHVTVVDALRMSLNVEAVKLSVGLGAERYYDYVRNFGFGQHTRIELAAEAIGDVKAVGDGRWRDVDLATNAFGQGIAVTPIQMIAAVAAVANQGRLMRPYVVQETRYANGRTVKTMPEVVRQVIRPETARTLTGLLGDSILAESTNKATVPGYRIAGKTGTAQIPIAGILDPRWTIASFAGYLPADDPRLVILVKLDKPQTSEWGSLVASPVFAAVAKQIVSQMGLPPDNVRQGK